MPDPVSKTQAIVPPDPLFLVMAAAIVAFSPLPGSDVAASLGYFALG